MKVHVKFVKSAMETAHWPPALTPEIAFLGRSNVGKSSLLNSLAGERIARTSSTPGRTRAINFFELRRAGHPQAEWMFADLPGYGYAKLPRALTAEWPTFIEPYLQHRPKLTLCVVLVDSRIPTQESDKQLLDWLRSAGRPFVVVATKTDCLSGNGLSNAMRRLQSELGVQELLAYSAKTGTGKDDLWTAIRAATTAEQQSA